MKAVTISLTAAALLAATPSLADNTCTPEQNKVLYELQERCSKDAAAFRKQPLFLGDEDFTNHYSLRFNKCFIRITDEFNDETNDRVWDVNERTVIAHRAFSLHSDHPMTCWAANPARFGNSEAPDYIILCSPVADGWGDNWDTLIRPYMEDAK